MALIKCSECGKEISDKSKVCINCGAPINKVEKKVENKLIHFLPLFISSVVFFILIMVYNVMNINDSDIFYTIFNTVLLIASIIAVILVFYIIPKERKIIFPISIIVSIFVIMSVIGTAFKAFN